MEELKGQGSDTYVKLKDIGKGSFGRVSLIKRISDEKTLVWKELAYGKMSEKEKQMLVSEVNILRELNHPHIVRYYDRVIDRSQAKIYIIMEYCQGGDISTLIKNSRKEGMYLPEDMIWIILSQVLLALQECHNRKEGKILHRDLKPGNIFLDERNNVKLGDFGLSKMMNGDSVFATTHVGTPYYMSPEQINDQKYNEKSDVWSAGCIIYELSALRAPFEAKTHLQLAQKIRAGNLKRIPDKYSQDLMEIIMLMLYQNADKRPGVDQLLQHPQIQVRIRERKYKDKYALLKKKEAEISQQTDQLQERVKAIQAQNLDLSEQEADLEKEIKQLEDELETQMTLAQEQRRVQGEEEARRKEMAQVNSERKRTIDVVGATHLGEADKRVISNSRTIDYNKGAASTAARDEFASRGGGSVSSPGFGFMKPALNTIQVGGYISKEDSDDDDAGFLARYQKYQQKHHGISSPNDIALKGYPEASKHSTIPVSSSRQSTSRWGNQNESSAENLRPMTRPMANTIQANPYKRQSSASSQSKRVDYRNHNLYRTNAANRPSSRPASRGRESSGRKVTAAGTSKGRPFGNATDSSSSSDFEYKYNRYKQRVREEVNGLQKNRELPSKPVYPPGGQPAMGTRLNQRKDSLSRYYQMQQQYV